MRGRTAVLMLILCWIAGMGCANKNSVPKGILPRDKMEQVMWDMAQADQYAALYLAKDSARMFQRVSGAMMLERSMPTPSRWGPIWAVKRCQ